MGLVACSLALMRGGRPLGGAGSGLIAGGWWFLRGVKLALAHAVGKRAVEGGGLQVGTSLV